VPLFAGLVVFGLGLRFYHYLVNYPVWHDEAALINNVLGKSPAEYFGPLYYSEAAPPLFLILEKAAVAVFGSGTFALRLVPFAASCAAFLGLVFIGRRVLPAGALPWFILLLATSDRLLWHACEAKPYAVDVLVAVIVLVTVVTPLNGPTIRAGSVSDGPTVANASGSYRTFLLYAALSPVLVFVSFPALFVLTGAALAWLPEVLRTRNNRVIAAYGLFGVVLCGSFLALLLGPIHAQRDETLIDCWQTYFPSWDRPWRVPGALLIRCTEVFRYAVEPIGNVLVVAALIGAVVMWRAGQRRLLAFLLLPPAFTALAWLVREYPFGATRVMVFAAPAAVLLIAAGLPALFTWLRWRARFATAAVITMLVFPALQAGYRVAVPWARLDSATPAAFVLEHRRPDEPVLGTLWEHTYYFRELGPLYRQIEPPPSYPPTPPPTFDCQTGKADEDGLHVNRLWVVALKNECEIDAALKRIPPSGAWQVVDRHDFRDMTAMRLDRKSVNVSTAQNNEPINAPARQNKIAQGNALGLGHPDDPKPCKGETRQNPLGIVSPLHRLVWVYSH
jgi:hypothetical protein